MTKSLLFAFCLLAVQLASAQENISLPIQQLKKIDSLKAQLAASKVADTNRVKILDHLSKAYDGYPDQALLYERDAVELAQKLDNKRLQLTTLRWLGTLLTTPHPSEALTYLLHALRISEDIKNKKEISQSVLQIAIFYTLQKDYVKAWQYLWRAKSLLEEIHDSVHLATALSLIGRLHSETGNQDSALLYLHKAYELALKVQFPFVVQRTLITLGNVYENKRLYSAALKYYRQSLGYNVLLGRPNPYLLMAKTFQKLGRADSALFYGKLSYNTSHGEDKLEASKLLWALYDGKNNDEAYKYLKLATRLADSLLLGEEALKIQNMAFQEQQNRQAIEAVKLETRNKIRLYLVLAVLASLLIIAVLLTKNNRRQQKANKALERQKQEIETQRAVTQQALEELKATQTQLIQSEKMASLGELTAGIAHEIQNPLNFVNNFSDINKELLIELKDEAGNGNIDEVIAIANGVIENEHKINHHGKRADSIVKGMLQHSRANTGKREPTDINALADEYLRLSYHGLRAKDKQFNAHFKTDFDETISEIEVVPQDIGRVLLNLYNNAFQAVEEKKKHQDDGYLPTVKVATRRLGNKIEILVSDNGTGIPDKVVDKIFQPFFTTKPTGQGTGLGLSLSYDIIKAHGGELKVETKEGEGAEFIITLPA